MHWRRRITIPNTKGSKKKWLIVSGIILSLIAISLVLAVALFLYTLPTTIKHIPYIDLQDSALVTPEGRIPLELMVSAHYPAGRRNPKAHIVLGESNIEGNDFPIRFRLIIGVFGGTYGTIQLFDFEPEYKSKKVVFPKEAFYQRNQGQTTPISVVIKEHHMEFDLPIPLSTYNFTMYGGTMSEARTIPVKAGEEDTHYLYIPLVVDSESFEIKLRFNVGIQSKEVCASVLCGGMSP